MHFYKLVDCNQGQVVSSEWRVGDHLDIVIQNKLIRFYKLVGLINGQWGVESSEWAITQTSLFKTS